MGMAIADRQTQQWVRWVDEPANTALRYTQDAQGQRTYLEIAIELLAPPDPIAERWDGAIGSRPATQAEMEAALPPDGEAFIAAVMAVFGTPARIKAVWIKQPVWYPSALKENWPFVEAFTKDALAGGDITQVEYDGIKAAALVHHIPITL